MRMRIFLVAVLLASACQVSHAEDVLPPERASGYFILNVTTDSRTIDININKDAPSIRDIKQDSISYIIRIQSEDAGTLEVKPLAVFVGGGDLVDRAYLEDEIRKMYPRPLYIDRNGDGSLSIHALDGEGGKIHLDPDHLVSRLKAPGDSDFFSADEIGLASLMLHVLWMRLEDHPTTKMGDLTPVTYAPIMGIGENADRVQQETTLLLLHGGVVQDEFIPGIFHGEIVDAEPIEMMEPMEPMDEAEFLEAKRFVQGIASMRISEKERTEIHHDRYFHYDKDLGLFAQQHRSQIMHIKREGEDSNGNPGMGTRIMASLNVRFQMLPEDHVLKFLEFLPGRVERDHEAMLEFMKMLQGD